MKIKPLFLCAALAAGCVESYPAAAVYIPKPTPEVMIEAQDKANALTGQGNALDGAAESNTEAGDVGFWGWLWLTIALFFGGE